MGLIWRVGVMVGMTVACLVLCAVAETEAPQYKCYSFMQTSSGTIYPDGDIIREVGTPYEAYCLFDPNLVDVKQVRFMHWGLKPEDQYQIPHTIVNDSAIMVNITHETAEEYFLKCEGDDNNLFLCQRSVKVGYLPQDVQNFSCVSKNWEQLNCSWTVPKNPVGVTHMLAYDVPGFKHKSECPKSQTGQSWCYWPENEFPLYSEWVMTFNATNKLMEEGVQFSHKVNVYEIVLPNPVDNLVAYVNGPYNVTLSWMLPYTMKAFPGGVIHEVSYRARRDGDSAEDVPWELYDRYLENAQGAKTNNFNKTINDLHAYVHYDFRVRIHTGSGSLQSHLWSEAEVCFATTSATRPTRAPLTDIGTFEVEETQSLRDIFVSWQTIDPMYRNGPNFHYEVTAYENGSHIPLVKSSHEVEIKSAYAKFLNMKKDVSYRFEIKSVNSEGPPSNESIKAIVNVPEKSDLLMPLNYFKVIAYSSSNKTMYSMRWKFTESHQKNENIETISLYWCKRDKYEERCENKLEWLTLDDPNVDSKNLTDLEDSFLYIFGISVNSRTSSSGIKWITCVADHGNRPAPIQDFSASAMSPTSVKLTWDLDCRAKAAEPIGFNISYCRVTNNVSNCPQGAEMFFERIMDESATQRVITELHPYSYYIFNIAIMTQIGLSKWSNSQALRTFEDKPSGPPLNLVVVHRGQDALTLSWAMPAVEHRNGRIRKYVVSSPLYQFNRIDVDATNSTFPNSEITTMTINGLDPYTNYSVNVVACTKSSHSSDCGTEFATITTRTKIGVPGKIDIIDQVGSVLKWENEECNGPKCSFEIKYRINGTNHFYITPAEKSAINLRDLNITCESHHKINISMRAFSHNEEGVVLQGPWKMDQITCPAAGSYNNDHVPNEPNKVKIILIQLPLNKRYKSLLDFLNVHNFISNSEEGEGQEKDEITPDQDSLEPSLILGGISGLNRESSIQRHVLGVERHWQSGMGTKRNEYGWQKSYYAEQTLVGAWNSPSEFTDELEQSGMGTRDVRESSLFREDNNDQQSAWSATRNQQVGGGGGRGANQPWIINRIGKQPWYFGENYFKLGKHNSNTREWHTENRIPMQSFLPGQNDASALDFHRIPNLNTDGVSVASATNVLYDTQTDVSEHPSRFTPLLAVSSADHTMEVPPNGNAAQESILVLLGQKGEYPAAENIENVDREVESDVSIRCPVINFMRTKEVDMKLNVTNDKFELNIRAQGNVSEVLKMLYQFSQNNVATLHANNAEREPIDSTSYSLPSDEDVITGNGSSSVVLIDSDDIHASGNQNMSELSGVVTAARNMPPIHRSENVIPIPTRELHNSSAISSAKQIRNALNHIEPPPVMLHHEEQTPQINNSNNDNNNDNNDNNNNNNNNDDDDDDDDITLTLPIEKQPTVSSSSVRSPRRTNTASVSVTPVEVSSSNQYILLNLLQGSKSPEKSDMAAEFITEQNGNLSFSHEDLMQSNMSFGHENGEQQTTTGNHTRQWQIYHANITDPPEPSTSSMIYKILGSFNGNVEGVNTQKSGNKFAAIKEINAYGQGNSESLLYMNRSGSHSHITHPSSNHDATLHSGISSDSEKIDVETSVISNHEGHLKAECPFDDLRKSHEVKIRLSKGGDGKFELKIQGKGGLFEVIENLYRQSETTEIKETDKVPGSLLPNESGLMDVTSDDIPEGSNDEKRAHIGGGRKVDTTISQNIFVKDEREFKSSDTVDVLHQTLVTVQHTVVTVQHAHTNNANDVVLSSSLSETESRNSRNGATSHDKSFESLPLQNVEQYYVGDLSSGNTEAQNVLPVNQDNQSSPAYQPEAPSDSSASHSDSSVHVDDDRSSIGSQSQNSNVTNTSSEEIQGEDRSRRIVSEAPNESSESIRGRNESGTKMFTLLK